MIITEISPQKHKGRYNLFVDDAFYSGIDDEVIDDSGQMEPVGSVDPL